MSYNPQTGLVYLPAQGVPLNLTGEKDFKQNASGPVKSGATTGWNFGFTLNAVPPKSLPFGRLIAWDPVKQKEAWHAEYVAPWNGGTLTTAGNLVFQGTADGRFIAYNATSGEKLWETPVGTGVVAAAATYSSTASNTSRSRSAGAACSESSSASAEQDAPGTVYTFAVGGKAPLPGFAKHQLGNLLTGVKYDPKDVADGTSIYVEACATCHGVPGVDKGGNVRNLGYFRDRDHRQPQGYRIQGPVQGTAACLTSPAS